MRSSRRTVTIMSGVSSDSGDGAARASAEYWAKVVQVRTWKDALGESVLDLLLFLLPLASGEPKYRVIVGTRGSGEAVGVREAFRRRSADAALVEVEKILDSTSPGEARLLLELDKP